MGRKSDKDLRKDLPIEQHYWSLEQLWSSYNVKPETGLSNSQVQEQREKHGWNRLTPPKSIPWWLLYIQQYTNFFSLLLIAGGE